VGARGRYSESPSSIDTPMRDGSFATVGIWILERDSALYEPLASNGTKVWFTQTVV
jgi:hypothetical protein